MMKKTVWYIELGEDGIQIGTEEVEDYEGF